MGRSIEQFVNVCISATVYYVFSRNLSDEGRKKDEGTVLRAPRCTIKYFRRELNETVWITLAKSNFANYRKTKLRFRALARPVHGGKTRVTKSRPTPQLVTIFRKRKDLPIIYIIRNNNSAGKKRRRQRRRRRRSLHVALDSVYL